MPEATLAVIFITSYLVGLSGAATPGPLLTLDVSESVRRGFWAGPLIALGHSALEFLVVVALAQGIGRFLTEDVVGAGVGFFGGLFLLWLGSKLVRSGWRRDVALDLRAGASGSDISPVLAGALVSLSNPYWTLWWLTVGANYTFWSLQQGAAGLSSFYVGHILADFSWYSLVSFLVASGRRFLTPGLYRGLLALCGAFLVLLGGFFLYSALSLATKLT